MNFTLGKMFLCLECLFSFFYSLPSLPSLPPFSSSPLFLKHTLFYTLYYPTSSLVLPKEHLSQSFRVS